MDEKKNELINKLKPLLELVPPCSNDIIGILKSRFEWLITWYIESEHGKTNDDDQVLNSFTVSAISELSSSCTFHYLVEWLRSDKNARQTLPSFQKQPFALKSERITEDSSEVNLDESTNEYDPNVYGKYYRIQKELHHNLALRKKQLNINEPKEAKRNDGTGKDFIELAFLEMMYNCHIEIYNLLWYNKERLKTKTSIRSIDKLPSIYGQINEMLEKMKKFNDRKFVSYCFQLFELEASYHFFFVPQVAQYMHKNALPIFTHIPYLINAFLSDGRKEKEDKPKFKIGNYFFYNMESIIKYDFETVKFINSNISENPNTNVKQAIHTYLMNKKKILKWKEIENIVTTLYFDIFPISEQRDWDDELFKQVADFLKNQYNFFSRFPKIELDTTKNPYTVCDYIRQIFQSESTFNQDELSFGRNELKKNRKQ